MSLGSEVSIGIDIGGTFTDFVVYFPGSTQFETFKILSTPHNPAEAVLQGINRIIKDIVESQPTKINLVHGSTIATNSLLERKGARTALVSTRGFSDVIQIGRQNREELYSLKIKPVEPLVPAELRFEVDERVDAQGLVIHPLEFDHGPELLATLKSLQVESIAVSFLFSFLHPEHEKTIAEYLRAAGYPVSSSCEILPEFREFERTSTTVVNAYVSPVLGRYLSFMEERLDSRYQLRVMQSNGGTIRAEVASWNGVRCILSGPAGGVIGCSYIASIARTGRTQGGTDHRMRVITFDMGGTSTDVSLVEDNPQVTSEAVISGCPIRIPVLDIHTIGAGGGSIARLDAGGALRVGPESAGSDPGPACYGKGDLPTVTDANLVLGRLCADYFLDGKMPLDFPRALKALTNLSHRMGTSPTQAALGIVKVVNAHMMRALRVISVERGYDPREFILLSFGGAGGLHAVELARNLGIPQVLVPPMAATLSAFGMLAADVVKDYSLTVMLPGDTPLAVIQDRLVGMVDNGRREVVEEGIPADLVAIECFADLRYAGQSYEITIPFNSSLLTTFQTQHSRLYGYARPEAPVEIVNLRVRATGKVIPPQIEARSPTRLGTEHAILSSRKVVLETGEQNLPFFKGESLDPGSKLEGPSIVVRSDTTVFLGLHDWAEVDAYGNLLITVNRQ